MKILSIILTVIIVYLSLFLISERYALNQAEETIEANVVAAIYREGRIKDLESKLAGKYVKTVTITAYVPEYPTTALNEKPVPGWHCAVSKALYEEWGLGGKVYAWGYGVHGVLDVMPDIYGDELRIDLMVGTVEEAKQIGVSTVRACLIEG
ncbi:MAG: hypothetical protein PHY56_00585 [Candidatus Omnitrophica bacterium]|nr:hypothetical protein [Candidatus Omnitrophota bacterium]